MTQTPIISGRRARHRGAPVEAPADPPQGQAAEPPPSADAKPAIGWWERMRGDTAARKARGGGRWWLRRWMREQPTSVADHLDFYLRQRERRPFGRPGWGLNTVSPLVNGVHAAVYAAYGASVGLLVTLAAYALAWIAQRPGRMLLLTVAAWIVHANLSTWLAGS